MTYRLGSLFDGSGGFPLAGSLCGIEPVWASEVEPYPIAVTKSRFPNMKHLGSVTDVHDGDIDPVDIITFGSPCQDLSVAGKRAGLKHEANGDEETTRSGLFMEAVRIIKEMREATNGEYPTFAVWENVPGAFSSNKGEDFRTVLEELIKIVEPSAVMPAVPKGGWPYADSYCGDGWSLAYRVFDAQYWGVPQRRRRIYLVADFRGQRAGEILFERKGLRGYFETGGTPWKGAAEDVKGCAGADDCEGECVTHTFQNTVQGWWNESGVGTTLRTPCGGDSTLANVVVQTVDGNILDDQGGQQIAVHTDGKAPTIRAETHGNLPCVLEAARSKAGQSMAGSIGWHEECAATLAAQCSGTEPTVCIKECLPFDTTQVTSPQNGNNPKWGDSCHPLAAQGHPPTVICKCYDARGNVDGENRVPSVCTKEAYSIENHPADSRVSLDESGKVQTLTSRMGTDGGNVPMAMQPKPVYCLQGNGIDRADTAGCNGKGWKENASYTLNTIDRPAVSYCIGNGQLNQLMLSEKCRTLDCMHDKQAVIVSDKGAGVRYIVRRLTPTECARLQGFPDNWGHPDHKDSFTQEELSFWKTVRDTYAAINGKSRKDYTEAQMLKWYNGLHTDSAEYKMWGNGIALPTALYVMQGIADALNELN